MTRGVSRPAARMRNVTRVDHHHFHGWQVCLKRGGQRHQRYFADEGDRQAGLRRALLWRDRMAAVLPPPRKFKKRFALNTTGVIGVTLARQRTRGGRLVHYYCATWFDERGQRRKRSFSVAKYGRREAWARAIEARRNALAVLLQPAGRGGASDGRQRERLSR